MEDKLQRIHRENPCIVKNTGEKVMVKETWNNFDDVKKWRNIIVTHEDGKDKEYHMEDILFPYFTK